MELLLTGKRYEVNAEQKLLAQTLADKLAQTYTTCKLVSLHLVCSQERGQNLVEASLAGKSLNLNATGKADDMTLALSGAIEKIDKQLRRYLEKIQDLSIKPDDKLKQKIWTSDDLSSTAALG